MRSWPPSRCSTSSTLPRITRFRLWRPEGIDPFGWSRGRRNDQTECKWGDPGAGSPLSSKQEAIYPVYYTDAAGQKLDGADRYTL